LPSGLDDPRSVRLLESFGELTREAHVAFGGVGSDARLHELSRHAMPDARERLAHVIGKSDEAACRTLAAVEALLPIAARLWQGAPDAAALARCAGAARGAGDRFRHGSSGIRMAWEYRDFTSLLIAQREEPRADRPRAARMERRGHALHAAADVVGPQPDVADLLAEPGL